ncbi:hypothetical protein CONLIGDRAFT_636703 [Coniochaeta ligniaria NRRL 30616]|uniref:Uncharacterized protein n=1 Tax=Coniochaeta ligniaria NRRL 30616 TaxID=1408157 RepID=A0A1J7IA08_9PEZI|nr:hypothetical protein CONLIGDRAFT_636703 [Coniochaeta ligniaria NRRL 30616]
MPRVHDRITAAVIITPMLPRQHGEKKELSIMQIPGVLRHSWCMPRCQTCITVSPRKPSTIYTQQGILQLPVVCIRDAGASGFFLCSCSALWICWSHWSDPPCRSWPAVRPEPMCSTIATSADHPTFSDPGRRAALLMRPPLSSDGRQPSPSRCSVLPKHACCVPVAPRYRGIADAASAHPEARVCYRPCPVQIYPPHWLECLYLQSIHSA